MKRILLKPSLDKGLLALRLLAAFALIRAHGLPKLLHLQETINHIPDPFGFGSTFSTFYAIFTNVVCALFVALGLFTRISAAFILGLTLTGLVFIHLQDGVKIQDTPLIYSVIFGFIAYVGGGYYSLDYRLKTKSYEI